MVLCDMLKDLILRLPLLIRYPFYLFLPFLDFLVLIEKKLAKNNSYSFWKRYVSGYWIVVQK
jgi:hypothetical protein